jgi:amino acid adenylation domain-containing protein
MIDLLQEWVTRHAEQRPEAIALVQGDWTMTYGQLERSSNQLARALKTAGCQRGDRVGLLVPKSPEAIVGMLGTLKADCIYVPIDTANPAARVTKILNVCDSRCILAAPPALGLLDQVLADEEFRGNSCVGWLGRPEAAGETIGSRFSWDDLECYSSTPVDYENSREDASHILFTSGSTGTPKGVVITHSNVIHFVEWATEYFGMGPSDRMSGQTPIHFDLSTFDIYGTFAVGARLHLVPPEVSLLPNRIAKFIRTSELTQWFSVPSVLNYMAKFDVVRPNDFPTLRRVLWCGEAFPTKSLIYWMRRVPHAGFTNLYGPTEATIASSYYTIPGCPSDESAPVPIGSPCRGEALLVLDDDLRPVPPGEVGNLYIRGVGLSPGYWRDPEKTRAAFLPDPHDPSPSSRLYRAGDLAKVGEDGLVYFIGRADWQIKSRGYRIELGEIEAALGADDHVVEAAAVAVPDELLGSRIVTFCAVRPGTGEDHLRRVCREHLPGHMVPARIVLVDALPRTPNGKVDRTRLEGDALAVPTVSGKAG